MIKDVAGRLLASDMDTRLVGATLSKDLGKENDAQNVTYDHWKTPAAGIPGLHRHMVNAAEHVML